MEGSIFFNCSSLIFSDEGSLWIKQIVSYQSLSTLVSFFLFRPRDYYKLSLYVIFSNIFDNLISLEYATRYIKLRSGT